MVGLVLAALLAVPSFAQEAQKNIGCFLGLNDADTPATLADCDAQDLLNVESNLQGTAAVKRKGFSKVADLTYATSPVSGSHSFIDSSGNRLDIVCHDRVCSKSTNGNAFSSFLSTAGSVGSLPRRWSLVDVGGNLYGANDKYDKIMKYDGTTRTSPVGMPQGSILELTQDRLVIADISGSPNRVHYSSAGNYDSFTIGVNPEDSFYDDIGAPGDKIRGLKHLNGILYVFKTASITACELGDQYTTRCAVISPNLGTTDPGSITVAGSCLYFRAQDKNYWELCRDGLKQISSKIPNLVKSQSGGLGGGENSNTQTTQADWQAGSQDPSGSWNTATTPGSIFPSSMAVISQQGGAVSTQSWVMAAVDTTAVSSAFYDYFEDGNFTSNPTWTVETGTWVVRGGALTNGEVVGGFDIISFPQLASSGTWSVVYYTTASAFSAEFVFVATTTDLNESSPPALSYAPDTMWVRHSGESSSSSCSVLLAKGDFVASSNTATSGLELSSRFCAASSTHTLRVSRSTNGYTAAWLDGVYMVSANFPVTSHETSRISGLQNNYSSSFGKVFVSRVYTPGFYENQVSTAYDTGFSTPTFGTYTVHLTSAAESSATFKTETSVSGTGSWTGLATVANAAKPSSAQRRYIRHQILLAPPSSLGSSAASISSVTLLAATTGQFRTACIQPNTSITAWGTLSCAEQLAGQGSIVYYATSAASCALLPSAPPVNNVGATQFGWTAQTNNATLSIAVGSATYIGWRSLLGSATDQAQVDACTLAWNEGTPAQPSWAVYDSIKNAVYWTTTINNASSSNRLLKYDRNLESWYPFDIPAQAPRIINNSLYFGGASSGTWNQYGLVDADAGSAINAYWRSKDIGSESPFAEKVFGRVSLLARNNGTGSLTLTATYSNAQATAYTVSLSTGTGIQYARFTDNLPGAQAHQFVNLRFGNNSTTPFEVLGLGVRWTERPWRTTNP